VTPFRPSPFAADLRLLREMSRYGRAVMFGNIVGLVDANVDTATVGRLLTAADVGFYNLAWRLSNLPATGLAYIVGRVMFPVYATMQDDLPAFREAFVTNIRRVTLVSLPVAVGIIVAAHPIVVGIFGRPWLPAVVPLQILGVFGLIRSYAGATGAVFQAAGRPEYVYRISLFHLVVLVGGLAALAPPYGVKGVALAVALSACASLIPSYRVALRILDLRLRDLLVRLERPAVCSLPPSVVLVVFELSTWPHLQEAARLGVLVGCGICIYAVSVCAFGRAEIRTIAAAFRG
jgi:O-antigen/teichoic acid export membrane protein